MHEVTPEDYMHLADRMVACRCMVEERPVEQASVRADAWAAVDSTSNWIDHHAVAARPKSMDVHNRAQIPAVEIDPGGCSYNPDKELHQDVLAQAVADEYLKEIDKELRPKVRHSWAAHLLQLALDLGHSQTLVMNVLFSNCQLHVRKELQNQRLLVSLSMQ